MSNQKTGTGSESGSCQIEKTGRGMGKRHTHTHTHTQEVEFKILFFNENSQDLKITSGNVGPDRVSRTSHFSFWKKTQTMSQTS